ncbi:MAG: hypothetical protein M1832_001629 [Thelocarpon impressellum]|nr:MAG: hypothetical protein M1832_001629 [Thelocarpon impressellum]
MDTSSPLSIIRAIVPRVPLVLGAALSHTLALSPTAHTWDLRTELVVRVLRSFVATPDPMPVSHAQRLSRHDPGVKGRMWVSRVELPGPEHSVLQAVIEAIRRLGDGSERFTVPEMRAVEAEWTGYRGGVGSSAPELRISEAEKYERMMKEVTSDVVILYLHGGAYYLMDPASHRPATGKLARLTGGRCLSVRYRLAPQHPFPAALLDALTAYLSLLYPPPGAPHAAVPASNIIFAGDSAGGGLALSLLQLILALHDPATDEPGSVSFHSTRVALPVPAAVTTNSAWADLTHSLPSIVRNSQFDFLPPMSTTRPAFPPCPAWPARPPRLDLYAEAPMLLHPLVSPVAAPSWRLAPPLYLIIGEEQLADESLALYAFARADGASTVVLEQYAAMPHCFALILPGLPGGRACLARWAAFCKDVVAGGAGSVQSGAKTIKARTLEVEALDVGTWQREDVREKMQEALRRRVDDEEDGQRALPKL